MDLLISQEIQVVYETTIEVEARLCPPRNNIPSPKTFQSENELLCIKAEKVYDWVAFCRDVQREVPIPAECNAAILECINADGNGTVQCEVIPNSSGIMVLDRVRNYPGISGASIVPIRFTILLQI